jgi:transcriptional regulator with GAF, ATPase, and Fis domain
MPQTRSGTKAGTAFPGTESVASFRTRIMAHNAQDTRRHWLAPIIPEILVATQPDGTLRIAEVSPSIAMWTGRSPGDLVGRRLSEVFDHMLPGLTVVVEDVSASGIPVRDYRMTFEDVSGREHTVLLQAFLSPVEAQVAQPYIVLRFQELPSSAAETEMPAEIRITHGMVGKSPALMNVVRKIEIYGPTEAPVLVTGETGTGKELAARAVHACSRRRKYPFVAVNCAALSPELLESELFGHERGAFTGAVRAHKGRFERAHQGTLFLDEIGEMPATAQTKLLRVLEDGEIERLGSEQALRIDVRLIVATNIALEQAVQAKEFRLDLYHRLAVLRIRMPPLRERLEDIPMLAAYYLEQFNQQYERRVRRLTPEALTLLQQYDWPGNIREFRNVLERVYVESTTEVIGRRAFDEWLEERARVVPGSWNLQTRHADLTTRAPLITPYHGAPLPRRPLLPYYRETPPTIEVEATGTDRGGAEQPLASPQAQNGDKLTPERIAWAYRQADGNITAAARLLGVHKATLYRHMKTHGLTREDLEATRQSETSTPTTTEDA